MFDIVAHPFSWPCCVRDEVTYVMLWSKSWQPVECTFLLAYSARHMNQTKIPDLSTCAVNIYFNIPLVCKGWPFIKCQAEFFLLAMFCISSSTTAWRSFLLYWITRVQIVLGDFSTLLKPLAINPLRISTVVWYITKGKPSREVILLKAALSDFSPYACKSSTTKTREEEVSCVCSQREASGCLD